jgi:hypothetical protein
MSITSTLWESSLKVYTETCNELFLRSTGLVTSEDLCSYLNNYRKLENISILFESSHSPQTEAVSLRSSGLVHSQCSRLACRWCYAPCPSFLMQLPKQLIIVAARPKA